MTSPTVTAAGVGHFCFGNLAPEGRVVKKSAVADEMNAHTADRPGIRTPEEEAVEAIL